MGNKERHVYEYGVDLDGSSAPARVIRIVGKRKKVLEIGAGPGSITRHLIANGDCDVTALEIDETAIKKLSGYTNKIISADLNDENWPSLLIEDGPYEIIVAADVLEHVYDPWKTLNLMRGLLSENGSVVVSLPHVGHSAICACLLNEDFDYRDWGLLDRTHIRFFGIKNMQSLFEGAGFAIEHAEFVMVRPEDSEFADIWRRLSTQIKSALAENTFGSVYQVVIKASPEKRVENKVNLLSLFAPEPPVGIRALGARYLPEAVKAPLRRLLGFSAHAR